MAPTTWLRNLTNDKSFMDENSPELVHINSGVTNLFTNWLDAINFLGFFINPAEEDWDVNGFAITNGNASGNILLDPDIAGKTIISSDLDMSDSNIINVALVDGVDVSTHAPRHILGGADEFDADQAGIDFTPANYSPTIPPEASDVDHLSSHLNAIDISLGDIGTIVNTTNTVDATVTPVATIPIADDSAMLIRVFITGFRTDGADQFFYERIAGVFRRAVGAATLQGTVSTPFTRESDGGYNATISVSGNNAIITVQGKAGEANNWKSSHIAVTIQ